jgi:hypothetical protein
MPMMIWVAVIVEIALQAWVDFAILLALQMINGFVGTQPLLVHPYMTLQYHCNAVDVSIV